MAMWVQPISGSSTVTVTPPAGEIWLLNSWTGFTAASAKVNFGTTGATTLWATGTSPGASTGSRTALVPAFSSSVPLVITPSTTQRGFLSGAKYAEADAPYIPRIVSGLVSVGSVLSLRPPVGKIYRLVGASVSVNTLAEYRIAISQDNGSTWLASVSTADSLIGGHADAWSWRDAPLGIQNGSVGNSTITTYVLELSEADFLTSRVYGTSTKSGAAGLTYDIQPPAGEEWVIDGLYANGGTSTVTYMANGVATGSAISFGSSGAQFTGPFRIDHDNYLRLTTSTTSSVTWTWLGRKV